MNREGIRKKADLLKRLEKLEVILAHPYGPTAPSIVPRHIEIHGGGMGWYSEYYPSQFVWDAIAEDLKEQIATLKGELDE